MASRDVDGDGRTDLRGSEPELVSAFANLVTNAVRYTPRGRVVLGATAGFLWLALATSG